MRAVQLRGGSDGAIRERIRRHNSKRTCRHFYIGVMERAGAATTPPDGRGAGVPLLRRSRCSIFGELAGTVAIDGSQRRRSDLDAHDRLRRAARADAARRVHHLRPGRESVDLARVPHAHVTGAAQRHAMGLDNSARRSQPVSGKHRLACGAAIAQIQALIATPGWPRHQYAREKPEFRHHFG